MAGGCGWNQMAADDSKGATGIAVAGARLESVAVDCGDADEHAEVPRASSNDQLTAPSFGFTG
jgi:hypothetical protein